MNATVIKTAPNKDDYEPVKVIIKGQEFELTRDQDNAVKDITNFLLNPAQNRYVLEGFAGTGKSTLLAHLLSIMPNIASLMKVINPDADTSMFNTVLLVASTNKAAGALMQTTGLSANTYHSELGLIVSRDPLTNKNKLYQTDRSDEIHNAIIIFDEAHMGSIDLWEHINTLCINCKILCVGDPAQLLPVNEAISPIETFDWPKTQLREVRRQDFDNPIQNMVQVARYAVETGRFMEFRTDGHYIKRVDEEQYKQFIIDTFSSNDMRAGHAKILCRTNKNVEYWNKLVKQHVHGTTEISVGDYVVCNKAVNNKQCRINTDQSVQVTHMETARWEHNDNVIEGFDVVLNHVHHAFMPNSLAEKKAMIKLYRKQGDAESTRIANNMEDNWIDLRDEYACTVNKSQGSTYQTVFIDLSDINKTWDKNTKARLLYVSSSRASHRIVMTGNIII